MMQPRRRHCIYPSPGVTLRLSRRPARVKRTVRRNAGGPSGFEPSLQRRDAAAGIRTVTFEILRPYQPVTKSRADRSHLRPVLAATLLVLSAVMAPLGDFTVAAACAAGAVAVCWGAVTSRSVDGTASMRRRE